jgi:hypothetical protein
MSNGWKIFKTDFPKGGQKLWVAGNVDATLASRRLGHRERDGGVASAIMGPFDYTLSEPNICVLDSAEYRIAGGAWIPEKDVLKIDRQIREEHGIVCRGGEMLQPWFVAKKSVADLCDVELKFSVEIEAMPEWIDLAMEEPENFAVEINGNPLDLARAEQWIDIAFYRIRLPSSFLQTGKNDVLLKTRYKGNSNLEAVYLLGEFGVQLSGAMRKIGPMPGKLEVGDICPQGFPFYSGAVTYTVPLPEKAARLQLPKIGGACARINGHFVGWDPFEAEVRGDSASVEIILTRRNTFGPLHDSQRVREWNGPDHWMTEGDEYSPVPVLLPSGLLSSPQFVSLKPAGQGKASDRWRRQTAIGNRYRGVDG